VVFQNRYHPAHIEARKRVGEGVFGEIQHVSAQLCTGRPRGFWKGWRLDPSAAGSGSIVGQAVHPIDLLRHVIGSEVVEVSAMTDQRPPERPVDESSYALLRFASGAIATVVSGTILPRSSNDVVIYGSAARLHCRNTLGSQAPGSQQQLVLEGDDQLSALLDYSTSTSAQRFGAMIDDFNQCVRDGREPAISGRNGLQMVKIANALLESSRHGRAVRIN
jgi:predicted dehydrogenase